MQSPGSEVGRFGDGVGNVGFASPGLLRVWNADANGFASSLELRDEGVNVWGGELGGGTVVVGDLMRTCKRWGRG